MKKVLVSGLIIILTFFSSCFDSEKAEEKCFAENIGVYRLDTNRTILDEQLRALPIDKFEITFLDDSTFYTNYRISFLEDTFGWWKSGTCGFESSGKIGFLNCPVRHSISPYGSKFKHLVIYGKIRAELGDNSREYWFERK